jgi:putative ABC transport system permease protein
MSVVPTDVRYALRRWATRPGLAITVVLTLGLGIGATTAIFSVVDGVLLRPLPWREPDRLVSAYIVREGWRTDPALSFNWNSQFLSWPNFRDLQKLNEFESVAAWRRTRLVAVWETGDVAQALNATSNFLATLGTGPHLGRMFTTAEDDTASDSILISYEAWQRRFGGVDGIIGRQVRLDDAPRTIVGVLAPHFQFEGQPPEFLLPFGTLTAGERGENNNAFRVVARLADGVTVEQAASRIALILNGGQGRNQRTSRLATIPDDQFGPARAPLYMLFGASVLLLLIACANVAGLLLGEIWTRRHEVAVRRALGAPQWQVARQMFVESALLGAAGGVVGVIAAQWITPVLVTLAPARLPRIDMVAVDARVLIFAVIVSGSMAILCGAAPSLTGSYIPPIDALRSGRGLAPFRSRSQRFIVSCQVALAVVLLAGAALLGETVFRLTSQPVGFDEQGLLVVGVVPRQRPVITDMLRRSEAQSELLARIRALPGVESAASTASPPFGTSYGSNSIEVSGRPGEFFSAQRQIVSEGFFMTMGMRMLRGREFERQDASRKIVEPALPGQESSDSLGVAIVSQELERRYFGGNATGQRIRFNRLWLDVIGVAPDAKSREYTDEATPAFYVYSTQMPYIAVGQFVVRASGDPTALVAALRDVVTSGDSQLAVTYVDTMRTMMARTVVNERYRAILSSAFGGAALLLAAIGLFGLLTRAVNERRREIGVRIAVGAKPGDVVRLVMREGGVLVAGGLVAGVPAALVAARLIRAQLYGVGPADPHVFVLVSGVLSVVAGGAMALPAIRASRTDPISTLRAE